MTEIYVENYLVINFAADFLIAVITSKILHIDLKYIKATFCAIVGAVYAVLSVYFAISGILGVLLNVLSTVIMCKIAYSLSSRRAFIRCVITFYIVGMLFGGATTAVSNILIKTAIHINRSLPLWVIMFISGVACFVFMLCGRLISGQLALSRVRVEAQLFGKKREFCFLCDSGNLAVDPYSGNPVIIVKAQSCKDLLGKYYYNFDNGDFSNPDVVIRLKMRIVPISTSVGSSVYTAFCADKTYVYIDGKKVKINACFAVDTREENTYDGTDGVFPYSLVSSLV